MLSDTHGAAPPPMTDPGHLDVVIHCGDLTEESKLDEYRTALQLLRSFKADLKLVIAGNHDWTLDDGAFAKKVAEMRPSEPDLQLIEQTFGATGEARQMLLDARTDGIVYLEEGTHCFALANGALLTVYASPFTPSPNEWGFSYAPGEAHAWEIAADVDAAITHGPAHGVLDYTASRQRAGSAGLFAAIARARPQLHCFGHIHEAWGAKRVAWVPEAAEEPSHFTDIDNEESEVLETLMGLRAGKFDDEERVAEKAARRKEVISRGYCLAEGRRPGAERDETLFVNAAVEGDGDGMQWPWVVELQLPRAEQVE